MTTPREPTGANLSCYRLLLNSEDSGHAMGTLDFAVTEDFHTEWIKSGGSNLDFALNDLLRGIYDEQQGGIVPFGVVSELPQGTILSLVIGSEAELRSVLRGAYMEAYGETYDVDY